MGPYENNAFEPGESAALAAALTAQEFDLAALVNHDTGNKILEGGHKNRQISVKVPVALIAHARDIDDVTNKIVMDTIAEQYETIGLGVHAYNAVPLSEGDLNLDIENFGEQVLAPQAQAVASYANDTVLAALLSEAVTVLMSGATPFAYDPANPVALFTQIRKYLRNKGVPTANLNVLVGTEVYAHLLDAKAITDASESGSTAALREAEVGKVRGLTVVERTDIGEGEILAFHRDAYTLGMRAPLAPRGAAFAASVSEAGVPIRHIMDYDTDFTADRSVLSTFVGVAKMPLWKVERTQDKGTDADRAAGTGFTAGAATVTKDASGAVVRIDTAQQDGVA